MPDLVSLKRTASSDDSLLAEPLEDSFPLSLFVSDEQVEALGIGDLNVGDQRILTARVKVSSVSANQREGGEESRTVTLDLMEGSVDPEPDRENQIAERLFGSE